jgi:membrane-associated phospholipid phosphatase
VLPVLAGLVVGGSTPRRRLAAIGVGYLLAVLIAYSRLRVGAHSLSEALTGLMLGSLASALALNAQRLPDIRPPPAVAGRGHAAVDAEPASERATILHA